MNIFICIYKYTHTHTHTHTHMPRCTYTHTCVDKFLEVKLLYQRECRFGVEIAKMLSKMTVPLYLMQQNS